MAHYVVRFLKTVSGDNGAHAEICQRSLDIDAENQAAAVEQAKRRFSALEGVPDWSLHADRVQVLPGDFPS
jgi:hypothetical protein